jgi:hypothetical protein
LRNLINGSKLFSSRQGEQMTPEIDQPFGIRVLMWWSLLNGLGAILGLVLFIHPIHPVFLSKYTLYTLPQTRADSAASIVLGLSFISLFWGIRRRLAVAWKFGWVLLVVSFSWLLAGALESLHTQPDSGGRVALAVVTVGFSCVGIYWGRWWYRQKKYFFRAGL